MTTFQPIDWTKHPLHTAAISGNRTEVERLIARGADVNELLNLELNGGPGLVGTPLHVAIRNWGFGDDALYHGHLEVVEALLAAGADVQLCRTWEGTPLHDAARWGLTRMAELLIASGADVNSNRDYGGRTPLHLAAANGRLKMVTYLLSKGADVDAAVDRSATSRHGGLGPAGILMRQFGNTPLQMAAHEGHVNVVWLLIERGACVGIDMAIRMVTSFRDRCDARFDEILAMLEKKQQSGLEKGSS